MDAEDDRANRKYSNKDTLRQQYENKIDQN